MSAFISTSTITDSSLISSHTKDSDGVPHRHSKAHQPSLKAPVYAHASVNPPPTDLKAHGHPFEATTLQGGDESRMKLNVPRLQCDIPAILSASPGSAWVPQHSVLMPTIGGQLFLALPCFRAGVVKAVGLDQDCCVGGVSGNGYDMGHGYRRQR